MVSSSTSPGPGGRVGTTSAMKFAGPGMPTGRAARSSRWLDGISGSSVRAGARGRYRAATNFSISALTSSGRSVGGKCPAPDSST